MALTQERPTRPRANIHPEPEQPSPLWNALTGLAISITSKRPSLINGINEMKVSLDQKDNDAIAFINGNSTPTELVDLIFAKPPFIYAAMQENPENTLIMVKPPGAIKITPAPNADIELANSILEDDEKGETRVKLSLPLRGNLNALQMKGLKERILLTCTSFLKAGKFTDGFTEKRLNDRSLWAIGVNETLQHLTKHETNTKGYDWSTHFNNRWNDDRYKSGKRTAVIMNLQMAKILELPHEIQSQIEAALKKAESGNDVFSTGEIDRGTDIIAEACAELITHLISTPSK